ncbi:glycosyl transferase [Clostridiaceae bacterium]|nr:glycosyl transferase [Clostridiaceae bacterium]RKI13851.1 glycosyl transferase [bacterium 1XD21-70]
MGGGYSQIKAELLLLAKAYSIGGYSYYHLLSGEDLPIKKQEELLDFWDRNNGKEFVAFDQKEFIEHDRVSYYYLFQDKIGRERHYFLRKLDQISVFLQKRLGFCRNAGIRFQKGANWFSISNDLAGYVLSMEGWIQKTFRYTLCCDEVFLQTIVVNSAFKDRLYHSGFDNDYSAVMRLIDWQRGQPYTFRKEDFGELVNSDKLFARKFQADVDEEIIKQIEEYLQ